MSVTLLEYSEESQTSTLYISPSKRRRVEDVEKTPQPTTKAIYNWTFSADSITACTVKDALTMRANDVDGFDFYWIGSVPCRSVRLVGMVVGVQVYEKRVIYTIDDGTEVVDCNHLRLPQKQRAEKKGQEKVALETPVFPRPVAAVGKFVNVIGRPRVQHESRIVQVDHIDVCSSPNDELLHTREVRRLHQTLYSQDKPFVIPEIRNPKTVYDTPATNATNTLFETPSTIRHAPPSSAASSPEKTMTIMSDAKKAGPSDEIPTSPHKLRHPSRLHTHDLTDNTFRIYLKHYIDHAPPYQDLSGYESDAGISQSISQMPSTPTKRSRSTYTDKTPRQSTISALGASSDIATPPAPRDKMGSDMTRPPTGFTLSYLRRVPELAMLAARVVHAVHKRIHRAERKKAKEKQVTPSHISSARASTVPSIPLSEPPEIPRIKYAGKVKRLFLWAIIELIKDGCIVLWDGPVRRCPDQTEMAMLADSSRLWKSSDSMSVTGNSLLFSNASSSVSRTSVNVTVESEEDLYPLSDPSPTEESYVSLTPAFLVPYILSAFNAIGDTNSKIGRPYDGASPERIVEWLRREDDRWMYLGKWTVLESLGLMKTQGIVWQMKSGRWDLCA